MIIPNIRIKLVPLEAQRRLRQLEPFIRPNLHRRPQRNQKLQRAEKEQHCEQCEPASGYFAAKHSLK